MACKSKSLPWPFKTLKKTSSWPLQPLVLQFAATVLAVPPQHRKDVASKMIERAVRVGARLAVEFGMPAPVFVEVARAMIVKEGGPAAQKALASATSAVKFEDASPEAQALVDKLFELADVADSDDGGETPEA